MATNETPIHSLPETTAQEHHDHHGASLRTYWIIAVVLLIATVAEVLLAEYLKDLGIVGGTLAGTMLAIAIFKAALVVMFYMHLRYEKRILWAIFAIPFFLVSLLALSLFANP